MAGHSKWANIKFRKGAQDAKRGKIFTKLIREISVSAKEGGADESSNARLREAIVKALKANMKRDTIDNAIKRSLKEGENDNLQAMRYEGYGPGGVAVLVDCLSDNKNRTVSEVRHAFTKNEGNLGTDGSVSYLFSKQGEILLSVGTDETSATDYAIELGAIDVNIDNHQLEIITRSENYHQIIEKLQQANYLIEETRLAFHAQTQIAVNLDQAEKLIRLVDQLEDLDDVQTVYTNAQFPEDFFNS